MNSTDNVCRAASDLLQGRPIDIDPMDEKILRAIHAELDNGSSIRQTASDLNVDRYVVRGVAKAIRNHR